MRLDTSKIANRQHTKALRASSALYRTAFASLALSAMFGNNAQALPVDPQVESGTVGFQTPSATDLVVNQGSERAVINWRNFDILHGESTRFNQPSANSIALNRVGDGNVTQILGKLSANGKLIIVNPNGVFFGAGSTVDVAGMIATTADISTNNFNAGKLIFDKPGRADASIINQGSITAQEGGLVALVAPAVRNDGVIAAKSGTVALGSGTAATIDMYGDGLYSFAVTGKTSNAGKDANGNTLSSAVENNGTIKAGTVLLTANAAKDIVSNVVNNTGVIEASTARVVGGTVILDGGSEGKVRVAGKITAKGTNIAQKGGKIDVKGQTIEVAGATLDASGVAGGGSVRIGGDLNGANDLGLAQTVLIDNASLIDVSAIENGDGGYASVWSDAGTTFAGTILGKGGANGGNGGKAEVSSYNGFDFSGFANLTAANGSAGTLLLDPLNINIGPIIAAATALILNTGTNVTLTTPAFGPQPGDINVNSVISWTGTGNLILNAIRDINVNRNILSSNATGTGNFGGIRLNAGNNITLTNATVRTTNGNITLIGKAVNLFNSVVRSFSGNIAINNSGAFFSDTPDAIYNDPTTTASVTLNQAPTGSIQNAVDAVGTTGSGRATLTLLNGTWFEQVVIDHDNFTLTGQGAGSVITVPGEALLTSYLTFNGLTITPVIYVNANNVDINYLTVDGADLATVGVAVENGYAHITDNTIFNSAGDGVHLEKADLSSVLRNVIYDTTAIFPQEMGNGVYVLDSNWVTVSGNHIYDTGWDGIKITRGQNLSMQNNLITDTDRVGIYVYDMRDADISYNTLRRNLRNLNDYASIVSIGAANLHILDNNIADALNGAGIQVHYNGGPNFIERNVVRNTAKHGIDVLNTPNILISDNWVGYEDNLGNAGIANNIMGDGILVRGSDNTWIQSNHIINTKALPLIEKGSGIHVINSNNVVIGGTGFGNDIRNSGWDHIKIGGGDNLLIQDNVTDVADRTAVYVNGATNTRIEDNLFQHTMNNATGFGAIWVDFHGGDLVIRNNEIYNVEFGSGIKVNNAQGYNLIALNQIDSTDSHGVEVYDTGSLLIVENHIRNSEQNGIHLEDIYNTFVDNNLIHDVNGHGIYANGLYVGTTGDSGLLEFSPLGDGYPQSVITNNVIYNTGANGITLNDVYNAYVVNNDIHDVAGDGIYATYLYNTQTEYHDDGVDEEPFKTALVLDPSAGEQDSIQNIFADNHVYRTGRDGMRIGYASNLVVVENMVYDICYVGINIFDAYVNWATSTVVANNQVFRTGSHGIKLDRVANAFVDGNSIHDIGSLQQHDSVPSGLASKDYEGDYEGDNGDEYENEDNLADAIHATNLYTNFAYGEPILNFVSTDDVEPELTYNYEYVGTPGKNIISNNQIFNILDDGISVEYASDVNILTNTIWNTGGDGIYGEDLTLSNNLEGPQRDGYAETVIEGNTIYNTGGHGINLNEAINVYVVNNTIHDVAGDGIRARNLTTTQFEDDSDDLPPSDTPFLVLKEGGQDSIQNIFADNKVYRTGENGIFIDTVDNLVVVLNTIYDICYNGIEVLNASVNWPTSTVIADNTITRTGQDGIRGNNITNIFVNNNTIHDIGSSGFHNSEGGDEPPMVFTPGVGIRLSNLNTQFKDAVRDIEGDEEMTYNYEYAGAPGYSVISNNTVYQIEDDAINIENSSNTQVYRNRLFSLGGDGIEGDNLFVTTNDVEEGFDGNEHTRIFTNEIFGAGGDGVNIETAANVEITGNQIHDLSGDGVFGQNFYTISNKLGTPFTTNIADNLIWGVGNDGIHLEDMQNLRVASNNTNTATRNGIFVKNNPPYSEETPGDGAYDNAVIVGNASFFNAGDGIHLEGLDNVEVDNNFVFSVGESGIHIVNSEFSNVTNNLVISSPNGILIEQSFSPSLSGNRLFGNGIGVSLFQSDEANLSGDIFGGNTIGINLDDSILAFIDNATITSPEAGVGLRIINGSGGTLVRNSSFTDGNIGVLIDGPGSDMQFVDNGSSFTGMNFYFVLQNGAMVGDTLDASQQTFDGIRASDFTPADLANAEDNKTIDVADDITLGNVFYKAFPLIEEPEVPITPFFFDQSILDDFQTNRRNVYRRGNFSYAGRAFNIVSDPIEPTSFSGLGSNLSLLNIASPAAAAQIANLFANLNPAAGGNNPAALANLNPGAGGNAQQVAALNPSAGGGLGGSCGNNFLNDGYVGNFSTTQCSLTNNQ